MGGNTGSELSGVGVLSMWIVERHSGHVYFNDERVNQLGASEVLLLECLIASVGQVKNKHDLLDFAWPKKIVAPNSLTVAIKNIRKVFSMKTTTLEIKTHHGKGYSLHGDLQEISIVDEFSESTTLEVEISGSMDGIIEEESVTFVDVIDDDSKMGISERNSGKNKIKSLLVTLIILVIMSASVVVWGYDKKVYCEEIISGSVVCGTRVLHEKEINIIKEHILSQKEKASKYVYGYNYTPKNIVVYSVI